MLQGYCSIVALMEEKHLKVKEIKWTLSKCHSWCTDVKNPSMLTKLEWSLSRSYVNTTPLKYMMWFRDQ